MPKIHPTAWVAPGAFVRGDVTIDEQANIWYNAVLRGDQESITVGKATSVQDNCVLHGDAGCNVVVGQYVTVGHGAVLHGCTVEDNCLIGMNAVVLDHAVIGAGSIVGAGAVVAAGTIVPPKSLVVGVPGKVKKTLTDEDVAGSIANAASAMRRPLNVNEPRLSAATSWATKAAPQISAVSVSNRFARTERFICRFFSLGMRIHRALRQASSYNSPVGLSTAFCS